MPALQSVHVPTPDDGLYFPTEHRVQSDGPVPNDPALQVHNAKAPLAAGELEFVGQVRHVALAVAPDAVEYVPAPQSVHTFCAAALYLPAPHTVQTPFEPKYPALQTQLLNKVDPAGPLAFVPQDVQVAAPGEVVYVPARHWVQGPPFGPA